jgi:hypothetical protein
MSLLSRSFEQFRDDVRASLEVLALDIGSVASLSLMTDRLDVFDVELRTQRDVRAAAAVDDERSKAGLLEEKERNRARLAGPLLRYQQSLREQERWKAAVAVLVGEAGAPESLEGLKASLAQLDRLAVSLEKQREERRRFAREIFDVLDDLRLSREALFKPVQELIRENRLIRDEYSLEFLANLGTTPEAIAGALFQLVKQNIGELRGEDESVAAVRGVAATCDWNVREDVVRFVDAILEKVERHARTAGQKGPGIAAMLRKEKKASEVYDLLFGLSFLEPGYSLLFQDTAIDQLSPGQRGALLLIFFLLVDKGRSPIIVDQPEENLDNETVVKLLVPVITQAKQRRQILMVTHNPNLAVVCDAEQVVHCRFDRKGGPAITYVTGSIEHSEMNLQVVNVLEGTKPAFDNRRAKYH